MNPSKTAIAVIALQLIAFVVTRGQQAPLQIAPWIAIVMFLTGAAAIAELRFQAQLWLLRKVALYQKAGSPRSLSKS